MDYDVVRTSVHNAYRDFKRNDREFYSSMDDFYKEGKKNPSVARIILQDHINNGREAARQMLADAAAIPSPNFLESQTFDARMNIYMLSLDSARRSIDAENMYKATAYFTDKAINKDQEEEFELMLEDRFINRKEFNDSWNEKYPKTGNIRERIIEANRISMNKVNKKADWFQKINYAKSLSEYNKDYPKTLNARYSLVINNQIREGEITKKVKGLFKRFSYKMLIKGNFGFKK